MMVTMMMVKMMEMMMRYLLWSIESYHVIIPNNQLLLITACLVVEDMMISWCFFSLWCWYRNFWIMASLEDKKDVLWKCLIVNFCQFFLQISVIDQSWERWKAQIFDGFVGIGRITQHQLHWLDKEYLNNIDLTYTLWLCYWSHKYSSLLQLNTLLGISW